MKAWQVNDNGTIREFGNELAAKRLNGTEPVEITITDGFIRKELATGELIKFTADELTERDIINSQREIKIRLVNIQARLLEIDKESIRALRALAIGSGTAADTDKLTALETEAEALRVELATLTGV